MKLVFFLALGVSLVGCVGDSTTDQKDAAPDVTADNVAPNDATSDVTMNDASDGGGGASDACGTPPLPNVHQGCTMTSCLRATQITCETAPGPCQGVGGHVLSCSGNADCDASACCLATSINVKSGCPFDAVVGVTTAATSCTTASNGACPSGQSQVCTTNAECFSGVCQDTVFDINGMKDVHFGTCQ